MSERFPLPPSFFYPDIFSKPITQIQVLVQIIKDLGTDEEKVTVLEKSPKGEWRSQQVGKGGKVKWNREVKAIGNQVIQRVRENKEQWETYAKANFRFNEEGNHPKDAPTEWKPPDWATHGESPIMEAPRVAVQKGKEVPSSGEEDDTDNPFLQMENPFSMPISEIPWIGEGSKWIWLPDTGLAKR